MKKCSALLLLVLLLAGCSTTARLRTEESRALQAQPTQAEKIPVYAQSKIDREYSILGQVIASADAGEDAERPVEQLKDEAAELGADAIVDMRLEIEIGYWQNGIKATGTAVKFK